MKNTPIAIFDFCDTLVDFQSADAFVAYVKQRTADTFRRRLIEGLRTFLIKTKLIRLLQKLDSSSYINKRLLLFELRGVSKKQLETFGESFFREVILNRYRPEVVKEISRLKQLGFRTCIASGGYDVYLAYVKKQLAVDELVCTSLKYKKGIFTGFFTGKDCLGNAKLTLVCKQLGKLLTDSQSVFYSDSATDLPLLKYCCKGVVVCTKIPDWATTHHLEVLVCKK